MLNKLNIKELGTLSLIILLGLGLRIYLAQDKFLHPWDERYHALVAKNMIQEPLHPKLYTNTPLPYNYKGWDGNYTWLHKQPVPLWLMAFSMKCFGTTEFSIRIPSIILSTLSILFTFLLGAILFNNRTGLIAAFFHSINGFLIELCAGRVATDHYDTLFLVFIEGSILFALLNSYKRNWIYCVLAGIFCGAAILTKWLPALIVFPVWFLFSYKKTVSKDLIKDCFVIFFTTVTIALPWQLYIYLKFPLEANWENNYNFLHFTTVLDEQGGTFFYFINKMRINYSEIIYLPILWFCYLLLKKDKKVLHSAALLIWIFLPLLFFSFSSTKMQGYISFISPALFIISAYFIDTLGSINTKTRALKALTISLIIISFALPIRYSIERLKFFDDYERTPVWALAMKQLNEKVKPTDKKILIYNVKRPIELMFYFNCIAYKDQSLEVSETVLKELNKKYYIIKNPTANL